MNNVKRKVVELLAKQSKITFFPGQEEELDDLTAKQMLLITVTGNNTYRGTHTKLLLVLSDDRYSDRVGIARAFTAKAIYDISTTVMLIDRLKCDLKFETDLWMGKEK